MALDPIKVDPKHYKLEFENDRIRVLRISYGPHEKSVMHGHPPCIVVMLNDVDFRVKFPYGRMQDMLGKAGQVLPFEEAQEHLPENLSDKSFEAILIELKS
jgi:hypothetical protein